MMLQFFPAKFLCWQQGIGLFRVECYKEDGNDKIWEIYETLVRVDHEEADIAKLLAENYEKQGDEETAIDYYKKAILRYINIGINSPTPVKAKEPTPSI